MRNVGLDEAQAGIKIAGRNINNLRYADDTTLTAEGEELKSLLMKEKDGETVETVADFILGGSKITADDDCSHEKKMLTPWKESYGQPRQHIKKQRHYFANKVLSSLS